MKPRVCLVSTVRHNVGDDFVREGIVWLLRQVLGEIEIRVVHKHFPVTARGRWAERLDAATRRVQSRLPVRVALSKLADTGPLDEAADAVLASDLVVQCGAPVYWKNAYSSCAGTEWYGPLIKRRWERVRARVPLLNLGAGSCQPLASDGAEVWEDAACCWFIRDLTAAARLTTVRDCLAQQIVRKCAGEVPLLPCPSIFAPRMAGIVPGEGGYVALNYMSAGGHFDLAGDAEVVRADWERRFCQTARALAERHRCLIVCHERTEYEEAARLLPAIPRRLAVNWRECLEAYAGCRFAVVNRVHGAVVAAAMGKPVLLAGNDSRLYTGRLIPGVQTLPVTCGAEEFESCLGKVVASGAVSGTADFLAKAETDYLKLLSSALRP